MSGRCVPLQWRRLDRRSPGAGARAGQRPGV